VRVIRGSVPESFAEAAPDAIALLHLDMNSAESEIGALDHLFDRVSPGGIVIFDDFGWTDYAPQRIAETAYMKERGYRILEMPTGQGFLIK
jgi:O-methyltransferase